VTEDGRQRVRRSLGEAGRTKDKMGKAENQGKRVQASRITGNQDTLQMMRGFARYPHTKCFQIRIYTVFLAFVVLIRVHPVRYVQLISHRVNLWNSRLMICSTIVESALQIGPVFFKTKPILWWGKIQVSSVLIKDYKEKSRFARQLEQSQTKPI
jgi:hypothetical protein